MNTQFASVVLNRWVYLDELGNPSTLVKHLDSNEHIGASVDKHGKITFEDGSVPVAVSSYTRKLARSGAIFPADARSAALLSVPFLPVEQLVADAKRCAISAFDAQHGNGAWNGLNGGSK